jgi:hypothetical protein
MEPKILVDLGALSLGGPGADRSLTWQLADDGLAEVVGCDLMGQLCHERSVCPGVLTARTCCCYDRTAAIG